MSILAVPAQYRLHCDSGISPQCLKTSKYLFMNQLQAEEFAGKKGGDWHLQPLSPDNPPQHLCKHCHDLFVQAVAKGAK